MEKTLKILVCYHKPAFLLSDDIFVPINCGRALAIQRNDKNLSWLLQNTIGDDTGENISEKNSSYNELTALYWAWKNYEVLGNPDYIGLMHYRRHFVFREEESPVINVNNIDENYFDFINYSHDSVQEILKNYDFAAHIGRVDQIFKHYEDMHKISDFTHALNILHKKYPMYSAVANKHIRQSEGCFCNMFIFPKDLFFSYCEWIFSILGQFESEVDISEKRLFISERLTGIFVKYAQTQGLRMKRLASAYINEPISIPIAMALQEDNLFPTAVSITALLEKKEKNTSFVFYLLSQGQPQAQTRQRLQAILDLYPNARLEFVDVEKIEGLKNSSFAYPDDYPLILHEALPSVKKLVYMNEKILALKDLTEFYSICNVDDFWVSGIPINKNDKKNRVISGNVYVMNLDSLRNHGFTDYCMKNYSTQKEASEIISDFCGENTGYFPDYFYTSAKSHPEIFNISSRRWELQNQFASRLIFEYNKNFEPWINVQAVTSIFWWDIAKLVPASIPFVQFNAKVAKRLMMIQQEEINNWKFPNIFTRAFRYYKKHGIIRVIKRLLCGRGKT